MKITRSISLLARSVCAGVLAYAAYAQVSTTGQVVGRVQDESGAVVPGVVVPVPTPVPLA